MVDGVDGGCAIVCGSTVAEREIMPEIEAILQADIDDRIINGAAVLAGTVDDDVFLLCVGHAENMRQVPMRLDTVIDVASVTKAAAGVTALLVCHSRGLIDFDAPFTEYLPGFQAKLFRPITVRELANHTSGFGDVPGQKQRLYFDESGAQMLRNMLITPPPRPPTVHADYACWNYILLAMILERCTGSSFPDFCEKEIFQPLDMADSRLGQPPPTVGQERLAQTMGTDTPGQISDFVAARIYRDGGSTANAGLFTTALDLSKLLRCYLRHGAVPGRPRLFSEASFAEAAPDRQSQVDGYRRLGWAIWDKWLHEDAFGSVLLHSGWSGQTILMHLPRKFFAIVLTTRCGDYERAKRNRFAIIERLLR